MWEKGEVRTSFFSPRGTRVPANRIARAGRGAGRHAAPRRQRRVHRPGVHHDQRLHRLRRPRGRVGAAGEDRGRPARETGEASSSSSPSPTSARLVLLDRVTPRTFSFARGDVVYLRSPSNQDRWVTRRLVALEGDWVTRAADDDVTKVPRGHCWIERVEAGTGGTGTAARCRWRCSTRGYRTCCGRRPRLGRCAGRPGRVAC